jgi:16S rRNA (cytidine1402-2'-O)-methyltransferase
MLAELVVAGLPTDRFFFEGFLPHKSGPRRARLAELAQVPGTLVFFESPRRLAETLADCATVLGPRGAAIARELTKIYESVRRGRLDELAATLALEDPPRGEIVLLVAPPEAGAAELAEADLDARIGEALGAYSVKDAASVVAAATGQPRRQVYARALQLASEKGK